MRPEAEPEPEPEAALARGRITAKSGNSKELFGSCLGDGRTTTTGTSSAVAGARTRVGEVVWNVAALAALAAATLVAAAAAAAAASSAPKCRARFCFMIVRGGVCVGWGGGGGGNDEGASDVAK